MQFEKMEGWSFWTGISVKGWRCIWQVRRYKKERDVEIVFKFFLYLLTCPVCLHPFTKLPVQNDPGSSSECLLEFDTGSKPLGHHGRSVIPLSLPVVIGGVPVSETMTNW